MYSLSLTAYIHNNPKDIKGYEGREKEYKYSSYGIYIASGADTREIIYKEFILNIFSKDSKKAAQKYYEFTKMMRNTGIMAEMGEDIIIHAYVKNESRSEKRHIDRNVDLDKVVELVCRVEEEDTEKA